MIKTNISNERLLMNTKFNQPGIFYEETAEGLSSGFPFMEIQKEQKIPNVLFIGAVKDTDERIEDSSDTIKEIVMQSYYNSEAIKKVLDEETYSSLKLALGLRKEKVNV